MRPDRREYLADRIQFDLSRSEPSLPVARIIWACIGIASTFAWAVWVRQ